LNPRLKIRVISVQKKITMKITLNRVNDNFHFELKTRASSKRRQPSWYGGNDMGASPMELVLMGVAGCSAIDMISI
jgi:putative redox protein